MIIHYLDQINEIQMIVFVFITVLCQWRLLNYSLDLSALHAHVTSE